MTRLKLLNCNFLNLRVTKTLLASVFIVLLVASGNAIAAKKMLAPITITGKVMDETGETIIGATIKSSAGGGVVTDANGSYALTTESNATLTVSYLGYVTQEVKVNGRTKINITLQSAANQLDDIVVIGYGTQKRKDVTGAITSVRLEDSPKTAVPFVNALEALQGTSGINVGPSNAAGATPNIVLRGQNSISANINPLIVLDGVIFEGSLNEINMNDIASFDVLKDGSAASIYGSRSGNGVLIITTKRGRTEKPQINFSTYYGVQNWTRIPKMKMGDEFLQWRKDNLSIRGQDITDMTKVLSPLEYKAYNEGHTLNWLDEVTQFAPIQNYQLSVAGKTNNTNYYFSAGYLDQKGVLYNDIFKKPNLTLKLENNITDWLSFGINGYYSSRDFTGNAPSLYMATYISPYSFRYVEGSDIYQRYPTGNTSMYSPFWGSPTNVTQPGIYDDDLNKQNSIRATGFINVKIPFIKGLNYRFEGTGNRANSNTGYFHHEFGEVNTLIPSDIANPTQFLSKANGYRTNIQSDSWVINNLLSYNRSFGGHNIDAMFGYSRDYGVSDQIKVNASDFSSAGSTVMGINGLNTGKVITTNPDFGKQTNVGYFGRLNYNYKQKYYVTGTFRRDGYSAFAEGHKYGSFPGGSVAWALSEEDFMKDVKVINYLKLRASYAKTGNQAVIPYSSLAFTDNSLFTVFGGNSFLITFPSTLANKTFTWETTNSFNLGVDFQLLDQRLTGNIDVYKTRTHDQLLTRFIPIFSGFNSVKSNLGEVENRGIEITLNSVNIKSDNGFSWNSGLSFWLNRNKVSSLPDGKDQPENGLFIGKSLGAIFDYTVDGIVQSSDTEYMNKYKTPAGAQVFFPGDLKLKDINGDGIIDVNDRSVIGYGKENFNFNISNTFNYKNFQLFFTVNSIIGGGKNNFFMSSNLRGLNPAALLPTSGNWIAGQNPWMPGRESNEFVRPNYGNPFNYGFYQSRTFVRLQTASLSYSFPKDILGKLKVDNLKVFVSGTNLLTFTGWTGLDPANGAQIGGNGGSSQTSVNANTPIMRTVSFGLNLGF